MNDLLLSDYSLRGFLDSRSQNMPTIFVRPSKLASNYFTAYCFSGASNKVCCLSI